MDKLLWICHKSAWVALRDGKVEIDGFLLLLDDLPLWLQISSAFLLQARALLLCKESNVVVSRRGE